MLLGQVVQVAVHAHTGEACARARPRTPSRARPCAGAPRRQNLDTACPLAGDSTWSTIWSTVCWLDLLAAHRTVRDPDTRIQQAQVVVDFRDRAHCGARVAGGGFLIDGDGRGQAPRYSPHPAFPSGPETGGHRWRGFPHTGAARRHRWYRNAREDLPLPGKAGQDDQLVPRDVRRLMFFRLCSRAPLMLIYSVSWIGLLLPRLLTQLVQFGRAAWRRVSNSSILAASRICSCRSADALFPLESQRGSCVWRACPHCLSLGRISPARP